MSQRFSVCAKQHMQVGEAILSKLRNRCKKRYFLYSAVSSPFDRPERFTRFASPGRHVHSDTNSAFPGRILARQQLRAMAKSITFPPLPIARYSFIQLSERRERKCPIFETVAHQNHDVLDVLTTSQLESLNESVTWILFHSDSPRLHYILCRDNRLQTAPCYPKGEDWFLDMKGYAVNCAMCVLHARLLVIQTPFDGRNN